MTQRKIWDRLGIYQRNGRAIWGRAPYMTDEQWAKAENPTRLTRFFAVLGLTYSPDRTRRKPFGGRTRD